MNDPDLDPRRLSDEELLRRIARGGPTDPQLERLNAEVLSRMRSHAVHARGERGPTPWSARNGGA